MKSVFITTIAASALMVGSALAQQATSAIPTSPAATNAGQESADPAEAGDTTLPTPGAGGASATGAIGTSVGASAAGDVNAIPGSPQDTSGGQNSADVNQAGGTTAIDAGAAGTTTGGNPPLQSNSAVPTSPAAENSGEESADPAN